MSYHPFGLDQCQSKWELLSTRFSYQRILLRQKKKKKKEDYWPHRCNQMLTFPHGIKLFKKAFLPFP